MNYYPLIIIKTYESHPFPFPKLPGYGSEALHLATLRDVVSTILQEG
jgi:hypothetical protein